MAKAVVETSSGRIRGNRTPEGVAFKGIPYGAPTRGPNRFRGPQPPEPWVHVRDCIEFGPLAPQISDTANITIGPWLTSRTFSERSMDEDCLVLNVWTPSPDERRRPVMVWLHGGGFSSGSGSDPRNWGDQLAAHGDVVVVSLNHRLGLLGHLYLGEIGDADYSDSGNAGLLDIVAALQWVGDNIENFGGDPRRVMIFGVSGGGAKVSTLLGTPAADDLFHRGSIESGTLLHALPASDATALAENTLAVLGIPTNRLDRLQDLPWSRLLEAQEPLLRPGLTWLDRTRFGPVVDGEVLPAHPFGPDASPYTADVPILLGSTKDEMTVTMAGQDWFGRITMDELRAMSVSLLGDRTDDLLDLYCRIRPGASPTELAVAMVADRLFAAQNTQAERRVQRTGAEVYLWRWDYETPAFDGVLGAYHGMVDTFVFRTFADNVRVGDRIENEDLVEIASQTWARFVHDGNPNNGLVPKWQPYDLEERATMIFDAPCHLERDPFPEIRTAWDANDFSM